MRKIVNTAKIRAKAAILILASSGLRIGELVKLRLGDIELDKDPPVEGLEVLKLRKGREE